MAVLRHILSILLLPVTVTLVVPYYILSSRPLPPLGLAPALLGAVVILCGLTLVFVTIRYFATLGRGTLAPWDPPKHLVTRILDENLPYGGRWEFDIAPEGQNDSRVTITERGWVSNPLFRFVSRFVVGHTSSLEAYLRALGKHFGTEPTPTVVAGRGT